MINTSLLLRFGVALAIGFLVGLEREYNYEKGERRFAGVRTFSLMGLAGALSAFAADELSSAMMFAGLTLVVGAFIVVAYYIEASHGQVGQTTQIAALVVWLTGALSYWDQLTLAAAIGVGTTVLLSIKLETQTLVRRITREDVYATLRFAVITVIILPVLPNQNFGPPPLDVFNPYNVWLIVVLISGISFLGYILIKLVTARQGIGLTGFLGGLASSTAVTLTFAQRSNDRSDLARPFALAITVAWTVMFARVVVAVTAINSRLLALLWVPMAAAGGVGLIYAIYLYRLQRSDEQGDIEFSNPFELGPAVRFGVIYAVVLLVARAAQIYLGEGGIYVSSVVTGVADVNAITLSMAELSRSSSGLSRDVAAQAIVLATMTNTITKGGIVLAVGSASLRRALLPGLVLMPIVGVGVAFLL